jgi:hypothetical protein
VADSQAGGKPAFFCVGTARAKTTSLLNILAFKFIFAIILLPQQGRICAQNKPLVSEGKTRYCQIMVQILPLDLITVGGFSAINFNARAKVKVVLERLPCLAERLEWYNANVCSLSLCNVQNPIKYRWGSNGETLTIYEGCEGYRNGNSNHNHIAIFRMLKEREISRLKESVGAAQDYAAKLKILFSTPGYRPDMEPVLYGNENEPTLEILPEIIEKIKAGTFFDTNNPIIDLRPETVEGTDDMHNDIRTVIKTKTIVYNGFAQAAFDKLYKHKEGFTELYNGFDFERQKAVLKDVLSQHRNPQKEIFRQKAIIETNFNYSPNYNGNSEPLTTFEILADGLDIDLGARILNQRDILEQTHIGEIVRYYHHLCGLEGFIHPEPEARGNKPVLPLTVYGTLDEIFKPEYQSKIPEFLQLLRETEKPAISDDNNYIGNDIGVVSVWYNSLESKGIVEKASNDAQIAALLKGKFIGLEMSESHLRSKRIRAKQNYKSLFDTEIAAIKTKKLNNFSGFNMLQSC